MESSNEAEQITPESQKGEFRYDAIVVLGAVMEWNEKTSNWEFPTIVEKYPGKLVEGKARAIATKEVQHLAPRILVTGGFDVQPKTGQPYSRAVELSRLITEKYKVPKDKVIPIGTGQEENTQGNLEDLVGYLKQDLSFLDRKKIAVLTPRFQKERAEIIFNQNPFFSQNQISIEWIIVEDVLTKRSPLYRAWESKVYNTEAAQINRQMEQKGIKDLKSGRYKSGN